MDKKIQKYLDSYKRLYFKGAIQNSKTKDLLDKKRMSLGLDAVETEEIILELFKSLEAVIDYIKGFLDLNYDGTTESLILDEFDTQEIQEFWQDMNLSDEDGMKCLEFAKGTFTNIKVVPEVTVVKTEDIAINNNITKSNFTLTEEKMNNDFIKDSNLYTFNVESKELIYMNESSVSVVDSSNEFILNQYKSILAMAKRSEDDSIQMRFLNLVLSYTMSYQNDILDLEDRKDLNIDNLTNIFYTRYEDFLEDFMIIIKETEIISIEDVPNYKLDEIFEVKNIRNYTSFLEQINDELDKGNNEEFAWMPKVALQYESAKVNTIIGRKTSEYIFKILQGCMNSGKKKYEGNIANRAFRTVDILLAQLLSNLTSYAIYVIKTLLDKSVSGQVKLEEIIESKENAINYIALAKSINKNKEYERYIGGIIDSLKEYPYYEESHIEIMKILDINVDEERMLLDFSHSIIVGAGENCVNINRRLIELNSDLYNSSIGELKKENVEFTKLRGVCENLRQKFKIRDVNTIVRCELQTFGKVISTINYSEVEESLRLELYKAQMIVYRNQDLDLEKKGNLIRGLRNIYSIDSDEVVIEAELNNFGMIFSDVDFLKVDFEIRRDMFKKRIEELEYERDQDYLENKIIEYKQTYRIDTKFAMNLEISKFGRWFGELDLTGLDNEDLEDFIVKLSKTIMLLNLTNEKKNILLNQLKEESGYSTKQFYEIQNRIGNKDIALNNEDSIDIEFIEKANEIFKKYPKIILEDKLLASGEVDFHCGVFIKKFEDIRESLRDEDLFLLRKSNNMDGFLITSKAIYHSNWSNALFIKDITRILWKEKSTLKGGQRYFRPYIHLESNLDSFRFDFVGFRQIDVFIKFLTDLINTNRNLRGLSNCEYSMISIAESSLTPSEMLEGNEFKEKYTGDINTLKNNNEIYGFIKKGISNELRRGIKLQDINTKFDSKIKNAIAAYAPIEQNEVPLISYDSTLFKSGKEGFMLTTKALYCKNKFGTPWKVTHKDMRFIKLEDEIIIFNDKQTTISSISEKERIEFRALLEFCSYIFKVG